MTVRKTAAWFYEIPVLTINSITRPKSLIQSDTTTNNEKITS